MKKIIKKTARIFPVLKISNYKMTFIFLIFLVGVLSCTKKNDQTEIVWDKWGVPHIYAPNDNASFYAEGYAQMHLHGNLLLELYGKSRGRAAEYWGKDYLENDLLIHRLGFPELAEKWRTEQNPELWELIQSFINGMNAYAAEHPQAFNEENIKVLPIEYDDVNLHYLNIMYTKFIGGAELGTVYNWNEIGSNAWAVGPSRSASGHAMLVQNPHLPWSDEFLFTEMHINTPKTNIYGVMLVGLPGIAFGFNENLGWSHTNNTIDNADSYELELTGSGGYLLDDKPEDFITSTKKIKIKTKEGVLLDSTITILHAAQGPVLKKGETKAIAIRMPGYDRSNGILRWWQMANAQNFNEFEKALKTLQLPFFNILYADKQGNIFYLFNGLIPVRKNGDWDYWSKTIKKSKSEDIWTSVHAYNDLPKLKNPHTGWLQNANNPPWINTYPPVLLPDSFPAYFSPRRFTFRPQRSVRMLLEDSSITYDELIEYKLSTRMELADRILDDLFDAIDLYGNELTNESKTVLEKWDRKADNNSTGTLLFTEWALQMNPQEQDMFKIKWSEKSPMDTPDGLSDPEQAVKILEETAVKIKETFGSLSVKWGDVCRINYNGIQLPGNGADGVFGNFRTTWAQKDTNNLYYIYGGDSWVGIIEFADKIKARVLLSYGNSTQKGSPHKGDQLQLFSEKKLRNAFFYRQDVLDNAKTVEVLLK